MNERVFNAYISYELRKDTERRSHAVPQVLCGPAHSEKKSTKMDRSRSQSGGLMLALQKTRTMVATTNSYRNKIARFNREEHVVGFLSKWGRVY